MSLELRKSKEEYFTGSGCWGGSRYVRIRRDTSGEEGFLANMTKFRGTVATAGRESIKHTG